MAGAVLLASGRIPCPQESLLYPGFWVCISAYLFILLFVHLTPIYLLNRLLQSILKTLVWVGPGEDPLL